MMIHKTMNQVNQNDQIEALKNIIKRHAEQGKLLVAELERLEKSLPKLTIFLRDETFTVATNYVNSYSNKGISLTDLGVPDHRKNLLEVLFSETDASKKTEIYDMVYGNKGMTIKIATETLRMLWELYHAATVVDEKKRMETLYNKILAKNKFVYNFMNYKHGEPDGLTRKIVNDFIAFYDTAVCTNNKPYLKDDLNVLLYLVDRNLPYIELYNNIIVKVKQWLTKGYSSVYTIAVK